MKARKKMVRKARNEKPLAQRLGLERLDKLTKRNCLERSNFLFKNVEKGKYKGDLRAKALHHAYWYKARAKQA
jgi:hypothetical protein